MIPNICKKKSVISGGVGGTGMIIFLMFFSNGDLSTDVSAIELVQDNIIELEKKDIIFEEYIKHDMEKMSILQEHYGEITTTLSELRSIACKDSTSYLC